MYYTDNDFVTDFYKLVCEFIRDGVNVNVSELSNRLAISERDLYRNMSRLTNSTPIRFINLIKFLGARELVMFDKPIDEVMIAIMIESESHFYKWFKISFETTPGKLRLNRGEVYKDLSMQFSVNRYVTFFETSLSFAKVIYSTKFNDAISKVLGDAYYHKIWMNTFFPDFVSQYNSMSSTKANKM